MCQVYVSRGVYAQYQLVAVFRWCGALAPDPKKRSDPARRTEVSDHRSDYSLPGTYDTAERSAHLRSEALDKYLAVQGIDRG